MRRIVVAFVVALLALSVAGCGGGATEEPVEPAGTQTEAPQTPTETPQPSSETTAAQGAVFYRFPVGEKTPVALADAVKSNQALLLFFFDPSQRVTNDTRQQINTVVDDYSEAIDFYAYNVGDFATVDAEGRIEVDQQALEDDSAGQAVVALANDLSVPFLPTTVVVDQQGYVIFQQAGFLDSDLIEREVLRATE